MNNIIHSVETLTVCSNVKPQLKILSENPFFNVSLLLIQTIIKFLTQIINSQIITDESILSAVSNSLESIKSKYNTAILRVAMLKMEQNPSAKAIIQSAQSRMSQLFNILESKCSSPSETPTFTNESSREMLDNLNQQLNALQLSIVDIISTIMVPLENPNTFSCIPIKYESNTISDTNPNDNSVLCFTETLENTETPIQIMLSTTEQLCSTILQSIPKFIDIIEDEIENTLIPQQNIGENQQDISGEENTVNNENGVNGVNGENNEEAGGGFDLLATLGFTSPEQPNQENQQEKKFQ